MTAARRRLDHLLVERGLAESREKARALILAGEVRVNGQRVDKAGQAVTGDARIEVAARPRYVSRGGVKLEAALERFGVNAAGKVCLDIGASTGGFTDCLLAHGAARVYAVDVGVTQLAWKLRTDPRVIVRDHTNARFLTPAAIGEPVDLAVCDVSFISATLVLAPAASCLAPGGAMIVLAKPQFEVGRGKTGKGGVVRDPALHAEACAKIEGALRTLGFVTAMMESPILGAEGNREFLFYASHQ